MGSRVQWEGLTELRRLLVPADSIKPHPKNPRRGNLDEIAASLTANGQMRPILVRAETREIVAGNHTYRAAVEKLGWNRVAAIVASMTADEAERYLLADNATADKGSYDSAALAKLLEPRMKQEGGLVGTGYKEGDVRALLAKLATDAGVPAQPRLPQSTEKRETVLQYDGTEHRRFHERLKILSREWGVEGVSEIVYRAVKEAAEQA